MIAAGMGVFSSQTLIDLYSAIYDTTDPSDLPTQMHGSCAKHSSARTSRHGWQQSAICWARQGRPSEGGVQGAGRACSDAGQPRREACKGRAGPHLRDARGRLRPGGSTLDFRPSADGRWNGDRCWAMLALAAPDIADVGTSRLNAFHPPRQEQDKMRSAFLVAGLAGLGRISNDTANSLNRRYGLALATTSWTKIIDAAAGEDRPATCWSLPVPACRRRLDRGAVGASLSCHRGPEAHRPGLHRADDRRRGALADVTADDRALVDRFLDMMAAEAGARSIPSPPIATISIAPRKRSERSDGRRRRVSSWSAGPTCAVYGCAALGCAEALLWLSGR